MKEDVLVASLDCIERTAHTFNSSTLEAEKQVDLWIPASLVYIVNSELAKAT